MKVHDLKTWPEHFNNIVKNTKTFELRKNDRDFKTGDSLLLREYCPIKNEFTGREVVRKVTYILKGGNFGLNEGFVIMSIIR